MAQALMLLMEERVEKAKVIAQRALELAVQRVTNDNTIRYLRACLFSLAAYIVIDLVLLYLFDPHVANTDTSSITWDAYVVGGMFGAVGAVFSIATRLQAFELRPCYDSHMNYWMSAIRVGMGVVASIVLLLFADTVLFDQVHKVLIQITWETAAVLGIIAGFAERLVPILLRQTADKIASTNGALEQAARSHAIHA
jgi:hypothetical protein